MTKMQRPTKAVIAAAGMGTRFLPQTKAMPKEMLPLVDKPIIQYVVEELVEAGIKDIIIVTGQAKRSIEDHFDIPSSDLIANLKMGGEKKKHFIDEVEAIANLANFVYVRQRRLYGNGVPLLDVEHLVGNEPFIYTWSDDFIMANPVRFKQLSDLYEQYGVSVLACIRAREQQDYLRYGFAGGRELEPGLIDIDKIVEKPGSHHESPSDLATVSGFLFTPEIFGYLHQAQELLQPGAELWYNDALKLMLADGKKVLAAEIKNGRYYDAGDKLEYIKTVVDFALRRKDIGDQFRDYLRGLVL
ncbi:MAG TPA: UTP--glucose-1-phosphate uridylyltransferase [Candidatus Saccharimonadales bacterium]|nr:UTP--glucose-1-phosphate uridylyltransferase [Candidatus Saccharimonadales bacterium]